MPEKRKSQEPTEEEIEVRFSPFLGISPRTYVPAAYAVLLLVVLFVVLILPGIRQYGSVVTFTSVPSGASILVDGIRVGSTPARVFVEAGDRAIEIRRPYFESYRQTHTVRGRLVGSLILPVRETITIQLPVADGPALLSDASRRFSEWALIGRASAQYQFPLIASQAVEDIVYGGGQTSELVPFIEAAAASTRSDSQLRDVIRARAIATQNGAALDGANLVATARAIAATAASRPATPLWFAGASRDVDGFNDYQSSDYFQNRLESYTTELITDSLRTDSAGQRLSPQILSGAGIRFARVPTGRYILGGIDEGNSGIDPFAVPSLQTVDEFYMMTTEVTVGTYRRFVADVPEFGPNRRDALVEAGLATEDYLAPFGDLTYFDRASENEPVTNVSYFATIAFADWLEGELPATLGNWSVRLPREVEWEWAAEANRQDPNAAWLHSSSNTGPRSATEDSAGRLGISDLLGNVWEWTSDWYRPAEYSWIAGYEADPPELPAAMKAVRGGSWANDDDDVTIRSRGGQNPTWSTPYLGFRVILVENDGE